MKTRFDENLIGAIGVILWQLREEAGLTQKQAAKLAGSAPARVSNIENGKADLLVCTVQHWANVYGYKLEFNFVPLSEDEKEEIADAGIVQSAAEVHGSLG